MLHVRISLHVRIVLHVRVVLQNKHILELKQIVRCVVCCPLEIQSFDWMIIRSARYYYICFSFCCHLKGEAEFGRSYLLQCCFYVLHTFSLFIELLDWLTLTLFQNVKTTKYCAAPTEKWPTAQRKNFATTLLRLDGIVSKDKREQKCPLGAPLAADAGLMVRDG